MSVVPSDQMMLITERGMIQRSRVEEVRETGRNAQGVRVMRLREGDSLVAIARIAEEDEPVDERSAVED